MDNFYIHHEDTEGGRDYITHLMSMLWKLRLQLRSLAHRLRPLPPGLGASNSEVRLLQVQIFILEEISHVRLGKKKKKHASNISTGCNEFNCSCFVAKSCLLQPYGLSPRGFSVHWISQERMLKWLPLSSLRDFTNPGVGPVSAAWRANPSPLSHQGSSLSSVITSETENAFPPYLHFKISLKWYKNDKKSTILKTRNISFARQGALLLLLLTRGLFLAHRLWQTYH